MQGERLINTYLIQIIVRKYNVDKAIFVNQQGLNTIQNEQVQNVATGTHYRFHEHFFQLFS